MAALNVRDLGAYIRDQRRSAQISVRQLAKLAGVSNPYLSQIERGLRKPSAEILQQIAKALRISAEAMYVQAGILDESTDSDVPAAVFGDHHLTERQKQVLIEIYESFRRENDAAGGTPADAAAAAPARSAGGADGEATAAPSTGSPAAGRARPRKRATPRPTRVAEPT